MSAAEDHVPRERSQEQQTSERKPVHGDNSLGTTDPGARVPAQEFQKHLKLKQGSESEFHTKARLDFFVRIQGSAYAQSCPTKDCDEDDDGNEGEDDNSRFTLTPMLGPCPKLFTLITLFFNKFI